MWNSDKLFQLQLHKTLLHFDSGLWISVRKVILNLGHFHRFPFWCILSIAISFNMVFCLFCFGARWNMSVSWFLCGTAESGYFPLWLGSASHKKRKKKKEVEMLSHRRMEIVENCWHGRIENYSPLDTIVIFCRKCSTWKEHAFARTVSTVISFFWRKWELDILFSVSVVWCAWTCSAVKCVWVVLSKTAENGFYLFCMHLLSTKK